IHLLAEPLVAGRSLRGPAWSRSRGLVPPRSGDGPTQRSACNAADPPHGRTHKPYTSFALHGKHLRACTVTRRAARPRWVRHADCPAPPWFPAVIRRTPHSPGGRRDERFETIARRVMADDGRRAVDLRHRAEK